MTDKELSAFGEKLYEAILMTPLPAGMVFAIATAIRQGVPWARLAPPLKLAVFKIASNCVPEPGDDGAGYAGAIPEAEGAASAARGPSSGGTPGAQPTDELPDDGPSATSTSAAGAGKAAGAEALGRPEEER